MSVTEFKRGVPTYKDKDDNEYGLLCETKEVCVTDNDGVTLEYKLQTLLQNINDIISGTQNVGKAQSADSLGGNSADAFAKVTDLTDYLPKNSSRLGGVGFDNTNYLNVTIDGTVYHIPISSSPCSTNLFTGTAENANFLNLSNGNEVNFKGLTGSVGMFFNYRNADTGEANTRRLDWYRFGAGMASGTDAIQLNMTEGAGTLRDILHTGNSSKVVISETAPSDTSALWVW